MDDHVHRLVRQAEQEVRLDHLERLVHETGGVNGDLLSHFPGRVAQRFVHRSTRHALRVPGAERAARRRQNEARQDLERRTADRSGGPENRDADAHARPNHRNSAAATGATKYTESSRSSTPPWPGINDDESFTPTSRLNSDSATSPT